MDSGWFTCFGLSSSFAPRGMPVACGKLRVATDHAHFAATQHGAAGVRMQRCASSFSCDRVQITRDKACSLHVAQRVYLICTTMCCIMYYTIINYKSQLMPLHVHLCGNPGSGTASRPPRLSMAGPRVDTCTKTIHYMMIWVILLLLRHMGCAAVASYQYASDACKCV